MKRTMTTLGALIAWTTQAIAATPVWAATNGREDNSDLFVWSFLACCASIVIAQLIPAVMVLLGAIKGVKKETAEVAPEVADTLPE